MWVFSRNASPLFAFFAKKRQNQEYRLENEGPFGPLPTNLQKRPQFRAIFAKNERK